MCALLLASVAPFGFQRDKFAESIAAVSEAGNDGDRVSLQIATLAGIVADSSKASARQIDELRATIEEVRLVAKPQEVVGGAFDDLVKDYDGKTVTEKNLASATDLAALQTQVDRLEAEVEKLKARSTTAGYPAVGGSGVKSGGSSGNSGVSYSAAIQPYQTAGVVTYSSGPRWTYPGDIASHLAGTHGQSVAGMSVPEMEALHDSLHNAESYGAGMTVYASASPRGTTRTYSRSYAGDACPGGVCPVSRTTRTVSRSGWYLGKFLGR